MDSVLWQRRRAQGTRRLTFWCAHLERQVEVDFARPGWLGQPARVLRCSAFEPPEAVTCVRRCAQASFRRPWPHALLGP